MAIKDKKGFAARMRATTSQRKTISFPLLSGDEVEMEYTPLNALDVMKIGEWFTEGQAPTEKEVVGSFLDMTTLARTSIIFVDCEQGRANYEAEPMELAVADLSVEAKRVIERSLAPGLGKSEKSLDQAIGRKIGKGDRRKSEGSSIPTA